MYPRADSAGTTPEGVPNYRCGQHTKMENQRTNASIYADILQIWKYPKNIWNHRYYGHEGWSHPVQKTKLLPQCKNCQRWGHTKSNCHKEPRCDKCAGKHTTLKCTKPKETPPKCYNCGKNHPANYWGSVVAKELQALRNKATNTTKALPRNGKPVATTRNEQLTTQSAAGEAPTYDAVVKAQTPQLQGTNCHCYNQEGCSVYIA